MSHAHHAKMRGMFDWNDLRVFLLLARERTLAATARSLRVNQSTVGRRLGGLERAAGTRLFERTPQGYVLTPAARAVLETIEQIERDAIAVERHLLGQDARVAGRVRLATSESLAKWFIVPHLPALRRAHPELIVELVAGNAPADLARREADVSLRMKKPEQPQLRARRLGVASWAIYAAETYLAGRRRPSLREHYAGQDVVSFAAELGGTVGARWVQTHADRARVAFTTNSMTTYAEAVAAGVGIGAIPCVYGDREPRLKRLLPAVIGHHDLWLVVHPDVRDSARVRAVLAFLTSLVEDHAAWLSGQSERRHGRVRLTKARVET